MSFKLQSQTDNRILMLNLTFGSNEMEDIIYIHMCVCVCEPNMIIR